MPMGFMLVTVSIFLFIRYLLVGTLGVVLLIGFLLWTMLGVVVINSSKGWVIGTVALFVVEGVVLGVVVYNGVVAT